MNQEVQYFNSKEAAKILGVNVSTIKRWTDEGKLECIRTAGGHRKFIMKHLSGFLEVNRKKTAKVNLFPIENESDLKLSNQILKGDFAYLTKQIKTQALRSNRDKVQKILNGLYLAQYPLHVIYDHLVTPVLHDIGDMWMDERISVSEEHLASQTMRDSIIRLQGIIKLPAAKKQKALCINLSSELHDIALKMVDHILELRGFKVYFSGQRTVLQKFDHLLANIKPDRLYTASTYFDDKEAIQKEFDAICEMCENQSVQIYVGGPGFDILNFDHPAVVKRLFSMEDVYRI